MTPASRGARGALLVAFVHLRQLWRSRRHQVAAGAAVAFVYTLLGLGWAATGGSGGALLALLAFTVLTVLLVAIPMLGSAMIGTARDAGVLPALQLTRLSAAQLAVGAWLSSAAAGLVGLLAVLPALLLAAVLDASGWGPLFSGLATLATAAGAGAALGVAAGASSSRRDVGTALAVVAVAALTVGTLIAYALMSAMTPQTVPLPVRMPVVALADPTSVAADEHGCAVVEQDVTRYRGDRVWPVLAANPLVVLADSLGGPADPGRPSVVRALSDTIRATQAGPSAAVVENCPAHPQVQENAAARSRTEQTEPEQAAAPSGDAARAQAAWPVWPLGLLGAVVATPLCLSWARRRLRTPQDNVGRARGRRVWPGSVRAGDLGGGTGTGPVTPPGRWFGIRLRAGRRTEPLRRRLRRRPAEYGR